MNSVSGTWSLPAVPRCASQIPTKIQDLAAEDFANVVIGEGDRGQVPTSSKILPNVSSLRLSACINPYFNSILVQHAFTWIPQAVDDILPRSITEDFMLAPEVHSPLTDLCASQDGEDLLKILESTNLILD